MAETDIDKSLLRAKCARQTRLRLEPEVQRDGIDIISAVQPAGGNMCGPHTIDALQAVQLRRPEHRHAGTLQGQQHADALAHQAGRGANQGPDRVPGSRARPRRRFHNSQRLHAPGQQLAGKLQIEWPAAGDQHAFAGADALHANQRLQCARGHDARKSPAGQRHRSFMCSGCQHQTPGSKRHRAASDHGGDLVDRKGAPRNGVGLYLHVRGDRTIAQRTAEAELRIRRRIGVAVGQRLGILATRTAAFVERHDGCPSLACGDGSGQPGETGANHQHVALPLLSRHVPRFAARLRQWQRRVAGDYHAVGHLGHARALADAAVHAHHTVETRPHAAVQPARCATRGVAERDDANSRERGGDGLAFQCRDRKAIELERDGAADAADRLVGKAHDAPA